MLLSLSVGASFAQNSEPKNPKLYVGTGFGFDYGGIGGKLEYLPIKNLSAFFGGGYNLLSFGWNVGGSFKISPDKRFSPNLMIMYGYNGVIKGSDWISEQYEMTSYGVSVGMNFDLKIGQKNKLSFGLFVPFRSAEFRENYKDAQDDKRIEIGALPPIGISIGYNIGF